MSVASTTTASLFQFLNEHRSTDGEWTLTGMSANDKGKYTVKDSEYDTFLTLAHKYIFGTPARSSSLLERHRELGPILVDLDFKYEPGGPLKREFTNDHIRKFIAHWVAALVYFHKVEDLEEDLDFYHLQKPAPETDKLKHKDGVHIQCPSLTTNPKLQFVIRGFLLNYGLIESVFAETGISNLADDCYDVSVIQRNNWFLYGACKPDKAQYTITKVWRVPIADIQTAVSDGDPSDFAELVDIMYDIMEEAPIPTNNLETMKLLSIRRGHEFATPLVLRGTRLPEWEALAPWTKGTARLEKGEKPLKNTIEYSEPDEALVVSTHTEDPLVTKNATSAEDLTLAYRLCKECINPERRAGEYQDWVNVAICLKNIANTEASFQAWADITRRVDPSHKKATYSDSELRAKWPLIRIDDTKKITLASLIHWAREDNPKTYESIRSETHTSWLIEFAKDTHVNVASFVLRLFRFEFRCSPSSRKGSFDWYQYVVGSHAWKFMPQPMIIRQRLSGEVRNEYVIAMRKVSDKFVVAEDGLRESLDKKRKLLYTIEQNLEKTAFKGNVMTECTEKFYDEEFVGRLNTTTTLFGVQNGVIDLHYVNSDAPGTKPRVLFRPGLPDDNISFQAGRSRTDNAIPYIPYDPANPKIQLLLDFFDKIYPNFELREFVLTLLASCLEGINREQKFYVMTGNGSNGKSKIVEKLMTFTMGEYAALLSTTAITRKKPDSGSANPDIIVVKNKRFIYMGEPDEGEKVNTALMKTFTGGDMVNARGLFSDQDQFSINGKMFLCCNDLPDVNKMDGGTWRRLRVIPHVAKFLAPGSPEINPDDHMYERDDDLDEKLKDWRVEFLSLLVHYYDTRYLPHGLKEPECVLSASNKYKADNDMFMAFFNDTFVKEIGVGPVTVKEVKEMWRAWKRNNGKSSDIKDTQLADRMKEVCGGGSTDKLFYNVRIADVVEDISGAGLLRPV